LWAPLDMEEHDADGVGPDPVGLSLSRANSSKDNDDCRRGGAVDAIAGGGAAGNEEPPPPVTWVVGFAFVAELLEFPEELVA
jgi:hypothetical protein